MDFCASVTELVGGEASPYHVGYKETLVEVAGEWIGNHFSIDSSGTLTEDWNFATNSLPGNPPAPGSYVLFWGPVDEHVTIALTAGACIEGGSGGGPNDPTHTGQMMMGDSLTF